MSTGGAILVPLDALGGNTYASRSGTTNSLREIQAEGRAYYHFSADLTLPMLEVRFTATKGDSTSADFYLPRLTAFGAFGGHAAVSLPSLSVAGTMTLPVWANGAFDLPLPTADGTGTAGVSYAGAITLPALTVAARLGHSVALLLPALRVTGSAWAMESGSLAATLPVLRVSGTLSLYSGVGRGAITLPVLVSGPYIVGRNALPMLLVTGAFALPTTYEAWVLNVRNNGVTRWANVPFTQILQHGDQTLMVGDGKLYLLGGDLDVAAPISWSFETGLDDMGKPGLKHVPYLYLDGIIDGEVQITVLDDRGREFAYEYDTKQRGAVHQPHRRKLGNGIRTRNVGFRISSTTGAYIELDALEPEATITQRSM